MKYAFLIIFLSVSLLAGGCAVGAGVTGGSVMALTAWIALLFMWLSAGVTDLLLDRPAEAAATPSRAAAIEAAPSVDVAPAPAPAPARAVAPGRSPDRWERPSRCR